MEGGGENIVVVFDFDKTIVDVDTDNWVIDNLGFTDLFNKLLPTMPWNSVMDRMMREMQEAGVTIKDIIEVLQRVPYHPRVISAIKAAHAAGCDLKILSDANRFFIETILKHLELQSYFSEIETNPGYVEDDDDDQGVRVRIKPHHDFNKAPHGCNGVCPPNMCKGFVMKRLLSQEHEKTFIYLGDGTGDYCPSLKLRSNDITMPRKNFPLWDLINVSNPDTMKAQVHEWIDGGDMEKVLTGLIKRNSLTHGVLSQNNRSASSSSFSSSTCSIISEEDEGSVSDPDHDSLSSVDNDNYNVTTPLDSQKPMPQPLPVSL